jgi:hypothetical protein
MLLFVLSSLRFFPSLSLLPPPPKTHQDFVIGSLMRSNLNKLSPSSSPAMALPPSKPFPPPLMPMHRYAAAAPPALNRTNSVGRLVSNFERDPVSHQYSGSGQQKYLFGQQKSLDPPPPPPPQQQNNGYNSAASRFLWERQKSSPNFMPQQPATNKHRSPPLKTRFRIGEGDVEIDPNPSGFGTLGRKWDYRGPTSLAKPPKPPPPAAASKPTLRHTVRVNWGSGIIRDFGILIATPREG